MPYNAIPIMIKDQAASLMEPNDLLARVEYFTDDAGDPTVAGWTILSDCADDEERANEAADACADTASQELGRHCVVVIPRSH